MWDVIIVGARCAGSAAARRFARSGRSVLLLDQGKLGADTLSTHGLLGHAVQQLQSLGLLEEVEATGAPRIHTMAFYPGDDGLVVPVQDAPGYNLCVRRTSLDPILVRGAQVAGATVRHQSHVEGLLWEDGRVTGVRGQSGDGKPFEERGRLVVGADGRHSLVAREVNTPSYNQAESASAALYAYWQGVGPLTCGPDVFQIAAGPGCDTLNAPCDGDQHIVVLIVSLQEFATVVGDPAAYEARLRSIPGLGPRLSKAQRVSRIYPVQRSEITGFFRKPLGPGWALVGDAAVCPHPALAHGIGDALRSTEILHEYVERAWAAGQPAESYGDECQQVRDAETVAPYFAGFRMSQVNFLRDPQTMAMIAAQSRPEGQSSAVAA